MEGNHVKRLGRPNLQGSADLDAALIDVGARLFQDQGFEATSMDQVAAVAGVSKHSLYRRYPNKEALFSDVFVQLFRRNKARWLQLHHDSLKQEPAHRSHALDAFKAFSRAIFDFSTDADALAFAALVFRERHRAPFLNEEIADMATAQNQEIMRYVKSAHAAGLFKSPGGPQSANHLMALMSCWPVLDRLLGQNELESAQARADYFEQAWTAFVESERSR